MLEKVQKRATKMVSSCSKLSYFDKLKYLGIPTLKYRRYRGDMIETGCVKMQDMKMQDVRMKDQVARQENAGHENEGPNCKA